MSIYQYIGGRIRELREEARLSQDSLATQLGVSTNTVSRWETATYKVSLADLDRLSKYFGVRLSSLLPPEEMSGSSQKALLSATGDLPQEDIQELISYAEYRMARHLLKSTSKRKDD